MNKENGFLADFLKCVFAFALIGAATFAHADYITWDTIVVEDKWINPQPGGYGGGGGGTGQGGSKPPNMTEEQREAYEEARAKQRIREIQCKGAQAAYSQASCRPRAPNPDGITGAVDRAVSSFSYSYLFVPSVQNFAQLLWSRPSGTTLRMQIGNSIREGVRNCELEAGKPIPSCVNQVLAFYGLNTFTFPVGEISGIDVNNAINRLLDGTTYNDPVLSAAANLIVQFSDGGFCAFVRAEAIKNACPVN